MYMVVHTIYVYTCTHNNIRSCILYTCNCTHSNIIMVVQKHAYYIRMCKEVMVGVKENTVSLFRFYCYSNRY